MDSEFLTDFEACRFLLEQNLLRHIPGRYFGSDEAYNFKICFTRFVRDSGPFPEPGVWRCRLRSTAELGSLGLVLWVAGFISKTKTPYG